MGTSYGRLTGTADTLSAAIIAAIDAPEKFKLACAALVANLTQQEAAHA